jgi:integrase
MARGSIEQRSPGTWSIRIELSPDPTNGKRRQKRMTFRGTKREAEKRLSELLHQLDTGGYINPGKVTIKDFLRQWLQDYAETNVRPTTLAGYQIIIEKHLVPGLGSIQLGQLTPAHIQSYYAKALKEGRKGGRDKGEGLGPRTVHAHHRLLKEALGHAVRWGLVSRNVAEAVDPPRYTTPEMHALDQDGVERVLAVFAGSKYYPLVHLAIFSGLRRSELLGLRWKDLDLINNSLTVNQVIHVLEGGKVVFQEPKTSRSKRTVTLGPLAILVLKGHREKIEAIRSDLGIPLTENDLVFAYPDGKMVTPHTVSQTFLLKMRKAGIEGIRFHDLRHSHVSLMIRQGVYPKTISDRIGHSTISTTMDVYGHLFSDTQREAALKFEEGFTIKTEPKETKEAP